MTDSHAQDNISDNNLLNASGAAGPVTGIKRFSHEAMATTFKLIFVHEDENYARQVASAAFAEVDRLEAELSRFIENSEVSRINNLPANKPMLLWIDTFECLRQGILNYTRTKGAFDVTIGPLVKCRRNKYRTSRIPTEQELSEARSRVGSNLIKLDENEHTIELLANHVEIDLGGIGKGYAVDCLAVFLRDYGITRALISGGGSTVLALDGPAENKGWHLSTSCPDNHEILATFDIKNMAISNSGLEEQGQHIIDPRTGRLTESRSAAWSFAPDAATADALSTAFMILTPEEIEQYCKLYKDTAAMIMAEPMEGKTKYDRISRFGQWNRIENFKFENV
jgi:FAD:protein FMN transferase